MIYEIHKEKIEVNDVIDHDLRNFIHILEQDYDAHIIKVQEFHSLTGIMYKIIFGLTKEYVGTFTLVYIPHKNKTTNELPPFHLTLSLGNIYSVLLPEEGIYCRVEAVEYLFKKLAKNYNKIRKDTFKRLKKIKTV